MEVSEVERKGGGEAEFCIPSLSTRSGTRVEFEKGMGSLKKRCE
jgi:hypothetical protein